MNSRSLSVVGSLVLVALLLVARILELQMHLVPTQALNVAFGAAVTGCLVALGTSHFSNGK